MLHHVVFAKIGAPDYTCPGTYAQRFFAEGEEHYAMSMPNGYGYPNKASDHWGLLAMLMNHLPGTHTVWVRYTVTYATGEQLLPVKPIWLDMNNCKADPIYDIPGTGGPGRPTRATSTSRCPRADGCSRREDTCTAAG